MNREEVLSSIQPLESDTKTKAWVFQVDKNFYHIAEYGGVYRVPEATSIWESNKKGKRSKNDAIFSITRKNHLKCINEFLDKIEEYEMSKAIEIEDEMKLVQEAHSPEPEKLSDEDQLQKMIEEEGKESPE